MGCGPGVVRYLRDLLSAVAGRCDSDLLRIAAGLVHGRGVLEDVFQLLSGGELDPVQDGRGALVDAEA